MLANTSRMRRTGFTLVEVLVAAGLCVLIMAVMATAFQAGLDSLSQLRTIASLQQQLRSAEDVIRRDLRYEHLESPFGNRVSDQRMDLWQPPTPPLPIMTALNQFPTSSGVSAKAWHPPVRGFFRIVQEGENYLLPVNTLRPIPSVTAGTNVNSPSQLEGYDNDGVLSSRAVNQILHYAIKMPSDRLDRANQSRVPMGTLQNPSYNLIANNGTALEDQTMLLGASNSSLANTATASLPTRWAEVCMYLDTSKPVNFTPTGVPYYTLYRRVRGLMETPPGNSAFWQNANVNPPILFQSGAAGVPSFPGLSCSPQFTGKPVNTAASITDPSNRLGGALSARSLALAPSAPFNAAPWFPFAPTDPLDYILPALDNTGAATGEDILLTNVLSFELKVNWDSNLTPGGIQCGLATLPPGQQGRLANSNAFTNPEGIFDDLPLPSTMPPGTPGFPGQDGNPFFARMNPSAPTNFPYLDPTGANGAINSGAFPNVFSLSTTGVTPGSRRVFDTWSRIEPSFPVPTNSAQVARWNTNPGPLGVLPVQTQQAILSAYNSIPANPPSGGNIVRQPYVDIVQGPPTSTTLNFGRWDERFIPFDGQGQGANAVPYGSTSLTAPTVLAPNPNFVPLAIRVKAIQIKIRIWDPKNNVARQITIVENL